MANEMIHSQDVENRIFVIRGERVMIDRDLAELYGVETKYLNRQVKRNLKRFPSEFCFRLTKRERKQLVTICHRFEPLKHSSVCPYVFTEHGVAMLASVLNSERAIKMSIIIIKTFVRLSKLMATHKELGYKLTELERKVEAHDQVISSIVEAIRKLLEPPPEPKKPPIGFRKD